MTDLEALRAELKNINFQLEQLQQRKLQVEAQIKAQRETLPPFTHQKLINAIYAAVNNSSTAWSIIQAAGLAYLAANRNAVYTGTHIRDITVLSPYHDAIIQQLIALPVPAPVKQFTVSGKEIMRYGKPFRFIGVNLRELSWYGSGTLPYAKWEHVKIQLDAAYDMGAKVVRFFIPHEQRSVEDALARALVILDELHQRDMVAIAVVSDNKWSGYTVPGDAVFKGTNGITPYQMYLKAWYQKHYQEKFMPFLKQFLTVMGHHPALFAVGLNEPQFNPYLPGYVVTTDDADIWLNFFRAFAGAIRTLSPALVTTGAVAMWDIFVQQAYANGKYAQRVSEIVDFMTIHSYQSSQRFGTTHFHFLNELKLDTPLIIEEFGCVDASWGMTAVRAFLDAGVSGVMPWGFQATDGDIGAGDGEGLTKTSQNGLPGHNWQPLYSFYQQQAKLLVK